MINKRPFIYLGVVVVLALVVFWIERPEAPRVSDVKDTYFINDYDSAKVARIEVEQLMSGVDIKKVGDAWQVSERVTPMKKSMAEKENETLPEAKWYNADATRVMSALGAFGGLDSGVLVSDNPEKKSLYQVDAAGITIRGFDEKDKPIFDVIVGKNGPDYSSSYIRKNGEDKVYLVPSTLTGIFSANPNDWRNRSILALEPNDVNELTVEKQKSSWTVKKGEDGNWKETAPKEEEINSEKMREVVRKVSQLNAVGFPKPDANISFDNPTAKIIISLAQDKTATLIIGNEDIPQMPITKDAKATAPKGSGPNANTAGAGKFYAKIEGGDEVYVISKSVLDAIPETPEK